MKYSKAIFALAAVVFGVTFVSTAAMAARVNRQATVSAMSGQVEWLKAGEANWQSVELNQTLETGDKIKTGAQATATLTLDEGSTLQLSENAEFAIQSLSKEASSEQLETLLAVLKGKVRAEVTPLKGGSEFEIETPAMVAAIRGTTLNVGVNPDGTVSASSEDGAVDLINEGENSFTAVMETGEEVLVELNPETGDITITCVNGPIDITGPDGVTRTLNTGDKIVFSKGAATFIALTEPAGDAPIVDTLLEPASGG